MCLSKKKKKKFKTWHDLHPLDRKQQESSEHNALLSTTLQTCAQHTYTDMINIGYIHLTYSICLQYIVHLAAFPKPHRHVEGTLKRLVWSQTHSCHFYSACQKSSTSWIKVLAEELQLETLQIINTVSMKTHFITSSLRVYFDQNLIVLHERKDFEQQTGTVENDKKYSFLWAMDHFWTGTEAAQDDILTGTFDSFYCM